MTNRVLIDSNNFKVSKPGVNVLTATAPKDFLLFNNYSTLGAYQTGTVTFNPIYPFYKQSYPLSNPTGYVPLVLVQQLNGSFSMGGGYYENISGFALENGGGFNNPGDPPEYAPMYFNTSESKGFRLFVSENFFEIEHIAIAPLTYRFLVFYPQTALANFTPLPRDIVPNTISIDNVVSAESSAFTNIENISGIDDAVFLTIEASPPLSANSSIRLFVSGSGAVSCTIDSGQSSPSSLAVAENGNNIQVQLYSTSGSAESYTLTLRNVSAGGTILDTFTMTNNTTTSLVNNMAWENASASGWVRSSAREISGPNVPVSLRMSSNISADAYGRQYQAFVDREGSPLPTAWTTTSVSSITVGANAGQDISWGIMSRTAMNNSITITNLTPAPDQIVDQFNINVLADNRITNKPQFNSIIANNSGNSTVTGVGNTFTFSGHSGIITITITIPGLGSNALLFPDDIADFRIYKNNTLIQTIDCSQAAQAVNLSVANGDQVRFECYLSLDGSDSAVDVSWFGAVGFFHPSFNNIFLGLFSINIVATRPVGGGGGGIGGT